ncbi:MAG: hypothetical protein Ct9H300mP23_11210 [Nitrospinota bacterium]|nr:MAG: hypothetical protein Ct9H300mP23_11210 [Nitrospinota bacterium]
MPGTLQQVDSTFKACRIVTHDRLEQALAYFVLVHLKRFQTNLMEGLSEAAP